MCVCNVAHLLAALDPCTGFYKSRLVGSGWGNSPYGLCGREATFESAEEVSGFAAVGPTCGRHRRAGGVKTRAADHWLHGHTL